MKNISIRLFVGLILITANARASEWKSSPFDHKFLVENQGQYLPSKEHTTGNILFGINQKGMDFFWGETGITIRVKEMYISDEARREAEREGNPEEIMERSEERLHYMNIVWEGGQIPSGIRKEGKAGHYYTFADPADSKGASGIRTEGFSKITYLNVYPGIDLEFTLPEKGGFKYSFIVHPGADPSLIRIRYSAKGLSLNAVTNGVEVATKKCGTWLEQNPVSFLSDGTPVTSKFQLNSGTIGFSLDSYDQSKMLVIDPFVSVITFPSGNPNYAASDKVAYDVAYDNAGNSWIYGGSDPLSLAKYGPGGNLIWIYTVPLGALWLIGDLEVDKNSGNAYVSEGYRGFGARIVKVSSAGMQMAMMPGNMKNLEISRMRLNCNGKLYVTGGGVPQGLWQVAQVDTNLSSMTSGVHVTTSQNGDHDINLMCLDPNGTAMYVNFNYPAPGSFDFLHDNEMYKLPIPGFAPSSWMNPGPIYDFQELSSIFYGGNSNGQWQSRLNAFNGMVCGNAFLYTYNGDSLIQWDKGTGAMVKMIRTGGKRHWNGGLDLDLCENIYASVGNAVKVYDGSLNLINTIQLPDTSCYDLKVDRMKNILYACGNNFVTSKSLGNAVPIPALTVSATGTPASGCSACNGTAAASASLGSSPCLNASGGPISYTWYPGGATGPTITGLCPGTYTVVASMVLTCLTTVSDTDTVVINGSGAFFDDFTWTGTCGAMSFADTLNAPGTTYNWTFPGGSPNSSTVQNPANIQYAPGTYTATLIVSAGTGCSDTITHAFTVGNAPTAAFQSTAPCLGGSTTLADGSVSAQGDPVTSWNWTMGSGSPSSSTIQNPIVVFSSPGTHTVSLVITTQSGCKDTIDQQVLVYHPPVASFTGNGSGCAPVCISNFADSSTSSDGNITSWFWMFPGGSPASSASQIPPTICYNTPGTYGASLIVTSNYGCTDTLTQPALVQVHSWPAAGFSVDEIQMPADNPTFQFHDGWVPNPGVTSWVWSFGDGTGDSSLTDPAHTYQVNNLHNEFMSFQVCLMVKNQFGCSDSICKIVEIVPEFEFYIPNAFTPNGDFMNDQFWGKGRGIKEYDIWIFDRWGNNIWHCRQEGMNSDWDGPGQEGMSSGCKWDGKVIPGGPDMGGNSRQPVEEDVYVWKVRLTDIFGRDHSYVGHVSVVK